MPEPLPHFFDLTADEFDALVASWDWPKFRAKQVRQWVYEKLIVDPRKMTNLSERDREQLAERLTFTTLTLNEHQSASDGTQKLLLDLESPSAERPSEESTPLPQLPNSEFPDPRMSTECVMIPAESEAGSKRRTACISSQVGCPVGCRFCASGLGGLDKNLTAGQIVEQVYWLNTLPALRDVGERITNIVFMGMGEPLSNFAKVTKAITILNADWAFNIGGRRITLSTVGLPAQIRRLADAALPPVTLAISLHAPNDDIRKRIIPWAEFVAIDQLIEAGRHYFEQTGREITVEYILLGGVNDQREHAKELAQIAKNLRCNVNLIRYNEVRGLEYNRPATDAVLAFQGVLREHGVNCHIRASRGRDIAAACGQLRHEKAIGST